MNNPNFNKILAEALARQNKVTNADRIRAMTDEEIEAWYWQMHKEMMWYADSRVHVHNWLKQEEVHDR